jgi:hypothetical protein
VKTPTRSDPLISILSADAPPRVRMSGFSCDFMNFPSLGKAVLASLFRRNFFAMTAVNPPVEAEPATKNVMVAIHAGHIGSFLSPGLEFEAGFFFRFNLTTNGFPPSGQLPGNFQIIGASDLSRNTVFQGHVISVPSFGRPSFASIAPWHVLSLTSFCPLTSGQFLRFGTLRLPP